ncbi:MAG: Aldehyde Dehydrogenase [Mahella sp.]|nr:Aldehyde Dehydrogenase [Mahella sp.]
MVAAAGGEGVIRAALKSGKKAITGGPGNPPVVVDETADIAKAAKDIIDGESYDNNVLCIAEKEVFVVESVADRLIAEMQKNHAYLIKSQEVADLTNVTIKDGEPNGQLIGKNPSVILKDIGIEVGDDVCTVIFEAPPEHPLVMIEQLMPVLPIVRVKDFEEAVKWAVKAEHRDCHTAILHSNDINRITEYARAMQMTALVVNAPSYSCMDPQSKTLVYAHTLTGPTGEGFCTPRHFTRQERIMLGGAFHFV